MNTDSLNKPDSMAEDELDKILNVASWQYNHDKNGRIDDDGMKRFNEAKAAINAYTTNKIIEARIDELQELQMADNIPDANKDQIYLWYLKNRIAELRKTL